MYRQRLRLRAARGRPTATLTVGDSAGRLTYVTAALGGMGIAVPLDGDQVDELVAVLVERRREQTGEARPFGRSVQNCTDAGAPPVGAAEVFTGMNLDPLGASSA